MTFFRVATFILLLAAGSAFAQPVQPGRDQAPQVRKSPAEIVKTLSLDANRAGKVEAILTAALAQHEAARNAMGANADEATRRVARAKADAEREETRRQLDAILTPQEHDKLRALLPPPPRGRGGQDGPPPPRN